MEDKPQEQKNSGQEDLNYQNTTQENNKSDAVSKQTNALEFSNRIDLTKLREAVAKIKAELGKVIIGQHDMIELLILSILADGHSLIEGVPGVAKTVTAKLLAKTMDVNFSRIQFTPDLMPSDILGTAIFNAKTSEFEFKKGPIFSNIILIDEINRAPAKTQAALFEAMAERQITIDGTEYEMEPPFLVFATQNPIEQEGTYRLPEAQLDRFLFKIKVEYPSLEQEVQILESKHLQKSISAENMIEGVLSAKEIATYQSTIREIIIENNLLKYIASIVDNTRSNANIYLGASPRASIALLEASKALAAINGRDFVTPDDIKKVATPILGHRIILTPEREMEGFTADKVVQMIIESIEVPR